LNNNCSEKSEQASFTSMESFGLPRYYYGSLHLPTGQGNFPVGIFISYLRFARCLNSGKNMKK
jgi:hypothetical protein